MATIGREKNQMSDKVRQEEEEKEISEEEKAKVVKALAEEKVDPYKPGEFDPVWLNLYMNDPFLGGVSLQVTKVANFSQPTAYVAVRRNGKSHEVVMGFNPKFLRELPMNKKLGVLKHELYHLIFQHIFTRRIGEKAYATMWNWACFPENTLLSCGSTIENPGKTTYGQSGKINILSPMERDYRGEMININAGGLTYTATPEHPFYVARRKNKSRPINLLKPVWVKAKDITSDDYVIVPKLPGTFSDKEISLDQFIVKGTDSLGRSTFANRVTVKDFPLTEETAWLLGLYAAEGSGKERVTLSLGSHETALQEKVCQIAEKHLQLSCSIDVGSQHKSVVNVRFGGPVLARAFKDWCGDGAKNKKVPEFILFNKNLGIVKAFLHGLADGDACIREDGLNILGISSRLLTTQARLLLARLDIGFFGSELVQKERKIRERTIKGGGRLYNTSWRWEIKTSLRNFNGKEILSNSNRWKSLEEGIAIPIKKVFKTDFSGKVYNISTQDHTYIVDGLLVHNCDMAINSIIGKENLPEFCIIPGVRPKDKEGNEQSNPYADFIANAPLMQASDYYFEELRKIQEEQGDGDGDMSEYGIGTMDDHGGWADLPPEVQDEIRGRVEEITRKAANKADRDNSWGNISAEIQEIIRRMISRQIDWRSIVRNFVGRCRTMDRTSTIRKINKKVPYKLPGVKRQMRASFACFMDQSGSMSDEDIALLFGELEGLSQETEIDCWHFDTEIDESSHMNWKKGMGFPKVLRTRCGGTDFQAVADFCNRQENRGKWSGVIILTDGYAPVMGAINGSRVLWVITETGTMDAVRPGDLACQMSRNKQFKTY